MNEKQLARKWAGRFGDSMRVLAKPPYSVLGLMLIALLGIVLVLCVAYNSLGLPEARLPALADMKWGVELYDRKDRYLCTLHHNGDRHAIPFSKMSKHIRNAVVAVEDHNFYTHRGIDFGSIARAVQANHKAGRIVQGGSTITQQLVRSLYLDKNDQSYTRKIKEALLAWEAEGRYSKNKILETYLNEVYFGGGVYGVERAAQHYFNKHANTLSIAESAFLAGLIKSPSPLGVPENRDRALKSQQNVIAKMSEYGYISPVEAKTAMSTQLAFTPGPHQQRYPYYVGYVMEVLRKELGADLWKKGWKVYTHLDVEAQQHAEKVLSSGIRSAPPGVKQGALVSMSLADGAILAIVGGVGSYEDNQWNRALFPHTAGSAFKPFVYLAGLMQGTLQPDTLINDAAISITEPFMPPYVPKNFDNKFMGWMTVRSALAYSRNICAVRVGHAAGFENVINVARLAGIRSQMDPYLSLALGYCAVSPLDMTTAYATLARGGVLVEPQVLRRIATAEGQEVKSFTAGQSANLPNEQVSQLVDMMQTVVQRGTGTAAMLGFAPVAGKTGTADQGKDIWFVGFTPNVVTTVWAGNDENKPIRGQHVTGGRVMAHIWRNYMRGLYAIHPPERMAFQYPETRFLDQMPFSMDSLLTVSSQSNASPYVRTYSWDQGGAQLASSQSNMPAELKKLLDYGIVRASDVQQLANLHGI